MMINEYVATKILLLVFPFLKEDEEHITQIIDHTGMIGTLNGIPNNYAASYESDDGMKFEVKLYTKESAVEPSIQCRAYELADINNDDEEWIETNKYDSEAQRFYDKLYTGETFLTDRKHMCIKIASDTSTNTFKCTNCSTKLADISPDRMKVEYDTINCPICDTKLEVNREINIEYNIK